MPAKLKNDHAIEIINNGLGENIRSQCLRAILDATEEPVQLDIPRKEGQGESETWMIDGDYYDAIVLAFPAEGEPMAADFDSHDWPEEFREQIIAAKEAYYDSQPNPFRAD